MVSPHPLYVPFVYRLDERRFSGGGHAFPVTSDPSRKLHTVDETPTLIMSPDICRMHHYSHIRKSIRTKLETQSASVHWGQDQIDGYVQAWKRWQPGDPAHFACGDWPTVEAEAPVPVPWAA